jgi:hypothetical protein
MKRRGVVRKRQVEHRSPAEKLEYVFNLRFPDIELEDVEELETALAEGSSLNEAFNTLMEEEEIPSGKRARFEADLRAALAFKAEAQSNERLEALYQETREAERTRIEAANERARAAREQSCFYNQPEAQAKFDEWVDLPFWTADEATALCVGKEPTVVNMESLQAEHSSFATEYRRRFERIRRSAETGSFGERGRVDPAMFIGWLRAREWKFPAELEAIAVLSPRAELTGSSAPQQPPHYPVKNERKEGKVPPSGALLKHIADVLGATVTEGGYVPVKKPLFFVVRDVLAQEGYYLSYRQYEREVWGSRENFESFYHAGNRPIHSDAKFAADEGRLRSVIQDGLRRHRDRGPRTKGGGESPH